MVYYSTKTFEHVTSTAFRQWLANTHCADIHGYGLTIKLVFGSNELDDKNWVIDFSSLKPIKQWLEDTFDHKTVIAVNDPHLNWFIEGEKRGILKLTILPAVGCEMFAVHIYNHVVEWLSINRHNKRVWLESVEVSEHSGNSAIYKNPTNKPHNILNYEPTEEYFKSSKAVRDYGSCEFCRNNHIRCNGKCETVQ